MRAPPMPPADPGRRDFLQLSLGGSLVLGLAGGMATLSGCAREAATAQGFHVLRPQDLPLVSRLLGGALDGALPTEPAARADAVQRTLASFDRLLHDTSPGVRGMFLQLLDLLDLGITRGPLFGLWKSWDDASDADAGAVLQRLAGSRVGFLRGAYNGLTTMTTMAWYLDAANVPAAIYPGPPKKVIA